LAFTTKTVSVSSNPSKRTLHKETSSVLETIWNSLLKAHSVNNTDL
jgi:hypothetical protein